MADIFNISPLSPIKFYHQSEVFGNANYAVTIPQTFNPQYNNRHIDHDFYYLNLKNWLTKQKYAIPYQITDRLTVQWLGVEDTIGGGTYHVRILDRDGNLVETITPDTQPSWVLSTGDVIWQLKKALYNYVDGVYFIQIIKHGFFSDPDYFVISEPIHVKEKWENTTLIKYRNSVNKFGCFFDTTICFQRRVFSTVYDLTMDPDFKTYKNQPGNQTMLGGITTRQWIFETEGIPPYEYDLLDRIFICDDITIDGVAYSRTEGSKLEKVPIPNNSLHGAKLSIAEVDANSNVVVPNVVDIIVGDAPTTDMFYIDYITYFSSPTKYVNKYFRGINHFLSYLNNEIFDYDGTDDILYFCVNHRNELIIKTTSTAFLSAYEGAAINQVLPYWIELTAQKNGALDYIQIDFNNNGAGTCNYVTMLEDQTQIDADGFAFTTFTTYTITATKEIKILLFLNSCVEVAINNSDPIITQIGGQLPDTCIVFSLGGNILSTIKNNMFTTCNQSLGYVDFHTNNLNVYGLNTILRHMHEASLNNNLDPVGGDLVLYDNAAAFSPEAGVYAATISNAGFTITL